ncbi:586_t:CDS:2 [Paraglomus brasilianum]|uniref:586_t:CDS:1 n=1 Tax=Paraglomus brasilianum TaxID=144538 RepID=A0A9N9CBB0_9GLOM|nr:586_t:CDS:2 [Paraglomus brasilianum]
MALEICYHNDTPLPSESPNVRTYVLYPLLHHQPVQLNSEINKTEERNHREVFVIDDNSLSIQSFEVVDSSAVSKEKRSV